MRLAYRYPVAKIFADALDERLAFSQDLRERFQTVLQEAVMNALLHGCIGLDSELRDSLDGVTMTHKLIEDWLNSKNGASSFLIVLARWSKDKLRVVIQNGGTRITGTTTPSLLDWKVVAHSGGGRGLMIMQAFCDHVSILPGGIGVELIFRR
jgi:anti-sigma regulatory factor (Ser/Thr protein kinase)